MDFTWTAEQQDLYTRVAEFVRGNLARPSAAPEGDLPREAWRLCGQLGLLSLCIAKEQGGLGANALTTAHAMEAFGRECRDMGLVFASAAHLFACVKPIAEFGSPELRSRTLERLASGEWVGANGITEEEAGSDVHALAASAVREGDFYVLNGIKSYVTNGPAADVVLVYARTNPEFGFLGLSAFAVEKTFPGFTGGEPIRKAGLQSVPASSIHLADCRVPATHRLGAEGQGSAIFGYSMQWERACLFAAYAGMMDRQLDALVAFARTRRQFRRAIGKNQAVSHKIADMKLRLEAARLLLYRACWRIDRGEDARMDVSMAKLAISEAVIESSLNAIHLHGAAGYSVEAGFERDLRDAIPSAIFSGTSEMQREIIAEALGL
ncbi:MAG TPA: acyl-CoA dehydrogenase family protein [Terracidiphilus sp.]|nr:acyl-CoA dehydrogenase family protein [Terracidiphilus sp.]